MGWGAGRKLHEVLANTAHVIAVEVMCAVAAIEHRAPLAAAELTQEAVARIRMVVARLDDDRPIGPDIEAIASLLNDGGFDELVDS